MENLYEDEYIQIRLDDAHSCLEWEWKKFVPSDKYKELLDKAQQLFQDKGCNKFLSDLKAMKAVPQDAQQWTDADWFPRMLQGGLKYIAVVNPDMGGGSMSMRKMKEEIEAKLSAIGVTQKFFNTIGEARAFIASI